MSVLSLVYPSKPGWHIIANGPVIQPKRRYVQRTCRMDIGYIVILVGIVAGVALYFWATRDDDEHKNKD